VITVSQLTRLNLSFSISLLLSFFRPAYIAVGLSFGHAKSRRFSASGTAASRALPSLRERDIASIMNAQKFKTPDAQRMLRDDRKWRWLNRTLQAG
jgi:hypothetical protein